MQVSKILIEIRDAKEQDLEAVVDLWEELAKYHAGLSDEFSLAWDSRRRWSKYLRLKFGEISTKLIVAVEEEKIVGFMLCMLSPNYPIFKERKIGLISDVYVLEERRRKGVAKMMLDVAVKWFRKNKVRSVHLSAAAANPDGQGAWKQLEFEPYMVYERLDVEKYKGAEARKVTRVTRKRKVKKKSLTQRIRLRRGPS